jgi:hypothetical protein
MVTKKKNEMPEFEADVAPILTSRLERVPGEVPRFVSDDTPKEKKPVSKKTTKEGLFRAEIARVKDLQKDKEWRSLIENTPCFARMWQDEIGDYCDEPDCDLRKMCESTWERVCGGLEDGEEPPKVRWQPEPVRKKVGRPRGATKKITKIGKWKNSTKYNRVGYQDIGRPIDKFAASLYFCFSDPSLLPDDWKYPAISKNISNRRDLAVEEFCREFGSGVWVIKRASYHKYIVDGKHLMRLWVDAGGGGWLDLNRILANALLKMGNTDLVKSPIKGYKTKYRFFPYRIYIGRDRDIELVKAALAKILKGLVKK